MRRKLVYENHIEVSEGGTLIISSVLCPLQSDEIKGKQIFKNSDNDKVVCCKIHGQEPLNKDFICPCFFGAVYPFSRDIVDCRHPTRLRLEELIRETVEAKIPGENS